jgi:hypothetical protein
MIQKPENIAVSEDPLRERLDKIHKHFVDFIEIWRNA